MPSEALRCPTCSAADSSRADAAGIHTCVYCGVRYRISAGTPTSLASVGAPRQRTALVGAMVAAVVIAAAGGVAFSLARRPTPVTIPPLEIPALPASPASPGAPAPAPTAPISVSAPAPAEAEVLPHASFALEHRRPSSGSTFYLVGWVTHDAPFTIDKPKVTAVLLDDAGKEVGTAFGYADDLVPAGARVPAVVLVMNPPAHKRIEFELVARKASYIPEQVGGLRLEHGPVGPDDFGGGFRVQGKVHHDGDRAARFVNVRVHALDAAGKLLGVDDTYADAELLAPGTAARFDVRMLPYEEKPASFELFVQGSPAP